MSMTLLQENTVIELVRIHSEIQTAANLKSIIHFLKKAIALCKDVPANYDQFDSAKFEAKKTYLKELRYEIGNTDNEFQELDTVKDYLKHSIANLSICFVPRGLDDVHDLLSFRKVSISLNFFGCESCSANMIFR